MDREARSAGILDDFAASSGLTSAEPPRRYLWTDAFAVYTWLGLHQRSGKPRFLELAQRAIQQVHDVLGQGGQHPTAGGLRIGKPLAERAPDEPYDPDLEWERDGQYYHYLTKWMHALERAARVTGDKRYRQRAVELGRAAHRAFAYPPGAPERLYWKMSVDLSRPLVPSMGMHDPLDGLVAMASLGLASEARELAHICAGRRWATDDPLGAGALLLDALALARLIARGHTDFHPLLREVVTDAVESVDAVASASPAQLPAARRLAFRELGLALGLHAVERLAEHVDVDRLPGFVPLGRALEDFWLDPAHQAAPTWIAHRDINAVTLAACLAPEGALS